jgi:hypothetical protein
MYLSEQLEQKWGKVLDHNGLQKIADPYRRAVTAIMLENTQRAISEERQMLSETLPPMNTGAGSGLAGFSGAAAAGGPVAGFDPILISLVRRSLPNLIAYDVCGVQPMTGPTGLIFAMRSRYVAGNNTVTNVASQTEALYNEANTAWSGNGVHTPFSTQVLLTLATSP